MINENHPDWCKGLTTLSAEELGRRKLDALQVGDIIHARTTRVPGMPFLVVAATKSTLTTRAMTSQFPLKFSRRTGRAMLQMEWDDEPRTWFITSVQPLPLEIHNLMLSLDRRMRLGSNGTTNPLDDGDKRALVNIHDHYTAHPLQLPGDVAASDSSASPSSA